MPIDRKIRVLCADDHPLLREGIAAAINGEPDMELVAEASSGREAIAAFRTHQPDITLMDLQMGELSGTDALIAIRREFPEARIIILTMYSGDAQALRALRAGAAGYMLKGMLRKQLAEVIRSVHAGKRYIPPEIASAIADHLEMGVLTPREIDVLRLVASGHSNKLAARVLKVSEETVKAHMRTITQKLSAHDRTHAVTIAMKRGFLDG